MGYDFKSEIELMMGSLQARNPEMVASVRIGAAWRTGMDPNIVAHTDAVYVIPDTNASDIIVYVDNNIWAQDLELQSEFLRMKLNILLHEMDVRDGRVEDTPMDSLLDAPNREKIKRLRFKVSKETYRSASSYRISTEEQLSDELKPIDANPIPLTDQEEADLLAAVAQIPNEELRQAAYAAAKADMELKKGMNSTQNK